MPNLSRSSNVLPSGCKTSDLCFISCQIKRLIIVLQLNDTDICKSNKLAVSQGESLSVINVEYDNSLKLFQQQLRLEFDVLSSWLQYNIFYFDTHFVLKFVCPTKLGTVWNWMKLPLPYSFLLQTKFQNS